MAGQNADRYIPWLMLAEEEVHTDDSCELFLLSLFPEATEEQIGDFVLYSIGRLHAGIILGLEVAGDDPINEIEAYQLGVQEGFDRKNEI